MTSWSPFWGIWAQNLARIWSQYPLKMATFSPFWRIPQVRVALSQSTQKHVFGYFWATFWRVFRYSPGTFWPLFPIFSLRLKIGKIGQNLIPPGLRSTQRVTIFQDFGQNGQISEKWLKTGQKCHHFSHKFRPKIAFFQRILGLICVFPSFSGNEKVVFLQILLAYIAVTEVASKICSFWRLFIVPRTEIIRGLMKSHGIFTTLFRVHENG